MADIRDNPEYGKWQPIETAPRRKAVLFWGETFELDSGVMNWKMETGSIQPFSDGQEDWYWGGIRLSEYDHLPTHWMPLPPAPEAK